MTKRNITIYLISDSSGETVLSASKAVTAQFCDIAQVTECMRPLVRSQRQVNEIIDEINKTKGIVFYTIVDNTLRNYLEDCCRNIGVECVFLLEKCFDAIARFLNVKTPITGIPGKHKVLDEEYYKKIDVINYTVQHDDGQISDNYNEADILLLGVSRTSKSPTALYLAQRGYKTANIPVIKGINIDLSGIHHPVIIGLMIAPDILAQIRENRILNIDQLTLQKSNPYMNLLEIQEELRYTKRLFAQFNIPIVDVTRKAIEEIAAEIINIYTAKHGANKIFY